MQALLALTLIASSASSPLPTASCQHQLHEIREARQTLIGLLASERALRRRFARAQTRAQRNAVIRLLGPVADQAAALARVIEHDERAYIRCVESQLSVDLRPISAGSSAPRMAQVTPA